MEIKNDGGEKPAIECNYNVRFYVDNMKNPRGTSMPYFHFHAFEYELYYLKSGTKRYIVDDMSYDLSEGDLMIIHPGENHRSTSTDTKPHYRLIIYFSKDSFERFGDIIERESLFDCLSPHMVSIPAKRRPEFERLFDLISCLDNDDLASEVGMARFEALMFDFLCRLSEVTKATTNLKSNPAVTQAIGYIKQNYRTNLTLKSVAEAVYTSPGRLSKLFPECTGMNFGEFLTDIRMKKAMELLRHGGKTISEVAAECGFSSPSYMGDVFRRVAGISPRDYQKLTVEPETIKHRPPDPPVRNFQGYKTKEK